MNLWLLYAFWLEVFLISWGVIILGHYISSLNSSFSKHSLMLATLISLPIFVTLLIANYVEE